MRKDLFLHVLSTARSGCLADEASESLHQCVEAARDTGKTAVITLMLTVKPNGHGQVSISDDIKTRVPKLDKGSTILFVTPEGNLTRDDPRQQNLPLREVLDERPGTLKQA